MAAQEERCNTGVLIDGDGTFNPNFATEMKLGNDKGPFAAVSIIGLQSSGKSTLMNQCFFTNFKEMDGSKGLSQTTRGICAAKYIAPKDDINILLLDTEGVGGLERAREGNETFQRKTAVFSLAISNMLIFNLKYDNVNLEQGARSPLMETVFQVTVAHFSTPIKRTTLLYVIRDYPWLCDLGVLEQRLKEQLDEIWKAISKPRATANASWRDYFTLGVVALSHYFYRREEFNTQAEWLRNKILEVVRVRHCRELNTASSFVAIAQENWKNIQQNTIINLQVNRMKVADVFCNDRKEVNIDKFDKDKGWDIIRGFVDSGTLVQRFGKDVSAIIDYYLCKYDEETQYLDESSRNHRRMQLTERLGKVAEPVYLSLAKSKRKEILPKFREVIVQDIKAGGKFQAMKKKMEELSKEFRSFLEDARIKQAKWDHTSAQVEKLESELSAHENGACTLITLLKKIKKHNKELWVGGACFAISSMLVAAFVAALAIVPPTAAVGAGAAAAANYGIESVVYQSAVSAFQGSAGSLSALGPFGQGANIIKTWVERKNTKKQLKMARDDDPITSQIWNDYKKSCRK